MEKIIKDTKAYRHNKRLLTKYKIDHEHVMYFYMEDIKRGVVPSESLGDIIDVGYTQYQTIYKELLSLITKHQVRIINSELFITTRPIGTTAGITPLSYYIIDKYKYSNEWLEENYNSSDKFIFSFKDLCHCRYMSVENAINYLYLENRFKTEEELYEEEKRKEAQKKEWDEQMDNSRHITETVAEDGYHIIKRFEGNCKCCGTFFSAEIDGFAPNCPNCGATLNLSFFDTISTVVSNGLHGTASDYILRRQFLEDDIDYEEN